MAVRAWVSWGTYPTLLIAAVLASHALLQQGAPALVAVACVTFAAALAVLGLQRWIPFTERWRGRPADFGIDLLHALITSAATELWRALTFGLAIQLGVWLTVAIGASLWPSEWPLLAQFALALLIGDFGAYWLHRACHTFPLFWRIHAMHHSSERLYAFSATRSHPVNVVLAWASAAMPLVLLGCPEPILVLTSVFTAVHGLVQHANIDLRHGWLNHVFATADLHRWHHSADIGESNSNYGSNLIVWDRVFGTYNLPVDRPHPERIGLEGIAIPENWFSHLASPFVLDRYTVQEIAELDDFTLEHEPALAVATPAPEPRASGPAH